MMGVTLRERVLTEIETRRLLDFLDYIEHEWPSLEDVPEGVDVFAGEPVYFPPHRTVPFECEITEIQEGQMEYVGLPDNEELSRLVADGHVESD